MNQIAVCRHFDVYDMRIRPDIAGSQHDIVFDGHTCRIVLPSKEADFGVSGSSQDFRAVSAVSWRGGEVTSLSVEMIRVEVKVDSYLTADLFPSGGPHAQVDVDEARRVFDEAAPIAAEVARRYLAQVRVNSGQTWLGPSSKSIRSVWSTDLIDSEGRRLAASFSDGIPVMLIPEDRALSSEKHWVAVGNVVSRTDPPLAETFLSDARSVFSRSDHEDNNQAVILSAIACEVKIKSRLQELCDDMQAPLLSIVLENPRDVSVAAVSLLDKTLQAVCGRSLRLDNRELYKAADQLFKDRNSIAHRGGAGLSEGVFRTHVRTAVAVFQYLDSL